MRGRQNSVHLEVCAHSALFTRPMSLLTIPSFFILKLSWCEYKLLGHLAMSNKPQKYELYLRQKKP